MREVRSDTLKNNTPQLRCTPPAATTPPPPIHMPPFHFFQPLHVLLLPLFLQPASPACPNNCNSHGDCLSPSSRCQCWAQNKHLNIYWQGADCSLQGCASATAWYDAAVSTDVAHQSTECSSRGNCDYGTGKCTCQEGFEGRACERLSCPNGCGGHGTCTSLESLAHHELLLYNVNWDHDKIYGCRCDAGFTGYDCSLHLCPYGDDPMSGTQYDEVQTVSCKGTGGFRFLFKGEITKELPHSASVNDVRQALHALKTLDDVVVTVANDGSETGQELCAPLDHSNQRIDPAGKFAITFTHELGDQPLLTTMTTGRMTMTVEETTKGTKEWLECSGRGLCDRSTGDCTCFSPFSSSDGHGHSGTRGDCGYLNENPWVAKPVEFTQTKLNDALSQGFSVSRPYVPKTAAEQDRYAEALIAGSVPNNVLQYDRSSKGRMTNCEKDCNHNGACGTWTGTALANQVHENPTMVPLTKTEPGSKGDVPTTYTQPTTDGMPSNDRRRMNGENQKDSRKLEGGFHNMILVTDRALVRHAALSQQIQILGLTQSLVDERPEFLQAVLASTFGAAALEIDLVSITTTRKGYLYVDFRVLIQSLDIESLESRMKSLKASMKATEQSNSDLAVLASHIETAYQDVKPSSISVKLSTPLLDTKDTSPELFAALALGGSKHSCGACQCKCGEQFGGADCSKRSCPRGRSWFSLPFQPNVAHSSTKLVLCSDAGTCDEASGLCNCRKGFGGQACERLACPTVNDKVCNGHGECLSMRMTAERNSIDSGNNEILYGHDPNNGNAWDADSVYGCYCDHGFTGYDCAIRSCDMGDDPRTTGQVFETQVLRCVDANGTPPSGNAVSAQDYAGTKTIKLNPDPESIDSTVAFFRLTFRGKETRRIRADATPTIMKAALEEITTIGRVSVTFHTSSAVCASSPGSIVSIVFQTETGGSAFADLSTGKKNDSPPPLRAGSEVVSVALTFAEDLNSKNIEGIHNVNSTKEANVCADRGMCNGNTGQCECFLGFKMGSMHGTGACDTIEGHTALRGDGVPLTRKMEFKGS